MPDSYSAFQCHCYIIVYTDQPVTSHYYVVFLQVEELFIQFAKKASAFNSWLEDAEEDLTDPVRCNSLEEIKVITSSLHRRCNHYTRIGEWVLELRTQCSN